MSEQSEPDLTAIGRSFIAPVSTEPFGEDPASPQPFAVASALRSGSGVQARLGDLLMLELEARALAPLYAVVTDTSECEIVESVSVRYWVFAHAADQRAERVDDPDRREGELLRAAVAAGAERLGRFYLALSERILLRRQPDSDPDDALDPEAVEVLNRTRAHVNQRLERLVDPRSERYLDPDEDMSHVAAFYEPGWTD